MTDTPPDISDMMQTLYKYLSKPPSPDNLLARAAEAQLQIDAIAGVLSRQIQAFGANAASRTDCLTLTSVREAVQADIGGQLAKADWASLAAVCKDEGQAISLLLYKSSGKPSPDPSEPPLPAWTITLRRCTIDEGRVRTQYTRPDRPGEETPGGLQEYRLSKALSFLHTNGIKCLEFENGDGISRQQRKWLANAVRKILIDCNSRVNLVVKATVCVSGQVRIGDLTGPVNMFTHISFYESGTCRIRLGPAPAFIAYSPKTDLELEKSVLVNRYELKAITQLDGCAWTPVELHELNWALAKVPEADRVVLRGLTFVRKKAAADDNEATLEAGSYRFGDRIITLLDAGFSAHDYGFVGSADEVGPYSHWTILHELGHAVEKYRLEAEHRRWDTTEVREQIAQLEAQKQALEQPPAKTSEPQATLPDTASRIRELDRQLLDLKTRLLEYTNKRQDMVTGLRANQISSECMQAFVGMVGEKSIPPCTGYAFRSWGEKKPGEFFAEAYSLFLNDPWFVKVVSVDLYNWFAAGRYRAGWQ